MSHNITIEGGTSVRLLTAGKYCDQDIIITATGGSEQPKKILRYIKFVVNAVRGGGTQMQFSEIDFLDANGNRFNYPSTTVVTSPDMPATAAAEGQDKIIDGLTSTKYCTVKFASGKYLLIDLGGGNGLDVRKYGYWQWWTANDNAARDPISFELWGSEDGESYELLDSADKVDVTTTRQAVAYANWVHISEETPDEGTEDLDEVLTEQEALIEELKTVLAGKADGYNQGYEDGAAAVESLMDMLIENNGGLTSLVNHRIKTVNQYLCNQNAKLVELDIPNVESVGTRAFCGCMITELNLPKCTSIGQYAFQSCTNIKTANLPELKTIGGYGMQSCGGLTSIVLPKVEYLDTAALYGCWKLHTIDLHICTAISATSIVHCSVLTTLILRSPTLCVLGGGGAFNNTPYAKGNGYIYVPSALVDSYKTATNWAAYAAQIRAIEDYPEITGG